MCGQVSSFESDDISNIYEELLREKSYNSVEGLRDEELISLVTGSIMWVILWLRKKLMEIGIFIYGY